MNKKKYIAPVMETYQIKAQSLLTGSVLDSTIPNPVVIPTTDPYDGEFSAPILEMEMIDPMIE